GSTRPAEVAAPRCTTASAPSTAVATLRSSTRSPSTTSTLGGPPRRGRRQRTRRQWPAAASLGRSAVPMKPLARVRSTLAMSRPHPCLLAELGHLLLGESGPAIPGVVHHDVAEAGLCLPEPVELPEAEADVVVALRDPDGSRE